MFGFDSSRRLKAENETSVAQLTSANAALLESKVSLESSLVTQQQTYQVINPQHDFWFHSFIWIYFFSTELIYILFQFVFFTVITRSAPKDNR